MADPLDNMQQQVDKDMELQARDGLRGHVSVFTCPECGGAMWQVDQKELLRFRCHVGHAYSADALLVEQSQALEAALWTAVRTFREKCVLSRQLAVRERERSNFTGADHFEEQAQVADRYGELIRQLLLTGVPAPQAERATGPNSVPPGPKE